LSGSDTLAHYQTVLNSVSFSSTSANPTNYGKDLTRTLAWQVNDGTHNSNTLQSTVTVAGVDQAPVLAGPGNTAGFTQGGAAVVAYPTITVADADSLNLASATVSITSGFLAGDKLSATTVTGVTAAYNTSTGVLTLTGSSAAANYQTMLDSVTYTSTSSNATNSGADLSRTLTWQVNDGALGSNKITSKVTVGTGGSVITSPATAGIAVESTAAPVAANATPTAANATFATTKAVMPAAVAADAAAADGVPRTAAATISAPQAAASKPATLVNPRLSMGSLTAAAGAHVVVPVNIDNARGMESMQLTIRYDARALTPVSLERSALTAGFTFNVVPGRPGELHIDAAGKNPMAADGGTLFGLKFAVAPAASGRLSLDFVSANLNGAALTVRDPKDNAIIVKAKDPQPAGAISGVKPTIALNGSASSFDLGNGKTHAWLDDFLSPTEGKSGNANSWTVVAKRRTLH